MADPFADPRFATDAAFDMDGETWEGDANKVDPGAPRVAEGFEPTTLPAEWLNWQLNLLGSWVHYLGAEDTARVLRMSAWRAWGGANSTSAAPTWIAQVFSTGGTEGHHLATGANFAALHLALSDIIPDGSTITKVRCLMKPGATAASRTAGLGVTLAVHVHDLSWTGLTSAFVKTGITVDDGTTNIQILDTGTISVGVNRTGPTETNSFARLTGGSDAATNRDLVYGWEITYTGPRVR